MEKIFENFEITLFDKIVDTFYTGVGAEREKAQKIVTQFKEHPDSWQKVDYILECSSSINSKFIALQILSELIQTRWNVLPNDQCEGIKNFIVGLVIKNGSEEYGGRVEKMFLGKLNLVLVQILKYEWPKKWPTFIPDIVNSSRTNLNLCENNMEILKLLSEEIFDFSAEQMTTVKTKNMKTQLCSEFSQIFQLCTEVLEKAQKPSLIISTLGALLRFLRWIPLGYIFETPLIENLKSKFLIVPAFRNVALACMTEIAGLVVGPEYNQKFLELFNSTMASITQIFPCSPDLDLAAIYDEGSVDERKFIQNLAIFITTFLGIHLKLVENSGNRDILMTTLEYLLRISMVDDREIFKICLEFWNKLVSGLYNEQPFSFVGNTPLMLGSIAETNSRRSIYSSVLSSLRVVMINKMVKPEEVLIVEDDNGEIVKEYVKESDTITLYKSMRECLVYLTHLNCEDTENIMTEKLARQVDGSEWSWNNLNRLCWAVGSISGAMSEEMEKRFLVTVIKDLLGLCEMKRGKDNKAVVASNIMYVVGQYPRFLRAHWKFLKTVVHKNFEFMHETHEGVQDMACDTFIKIAQKCKNHFVVIQAGERNLFVDEILEGMSDVIADLQISQVHTFFEAVGYMIGAQANKDLQASELASLMSMPNTMWDNIISQASKNSNAIQNQENLRMLSNVLKTNFFTCKSVGEAFITQLSRIYLDMLSLYKAISEIVSSTIASQGVAVAKTLMIKSMRSVKSDILRLVEIFVDKTSDTVLVATEFSPSLFEAILGDYSRNVDNARDSAVLSVTTMIIEKCGPLMNDKISPILDSTFECTLSMINKNFAEYPDHRNGFFKLIRAINKHCFSSLLRLPQVQFKLVVDSVVWAFKHTMRDVGEMGLSICLELLENIKETDQSIANSFYQNFFLSLLQDVFFVLTDSSHKSGFKLQASILAHLFDLLKTINIPLSSNHADNNVFIQEFMMNLLQNAFPHLQKTQFEIFIRGLFDLNSDINTFKLHLRDFLIQLKEFSGDNAELFIEEAELERERKLKAEMEVAKRVPGMIKPQDMDE